MCMLLIGCSYQRVERKGGAVDGDVDRASVLGGCVDRISVSIKDAY